MGNTSGSGVVVGQLRDFIFAGVAQFELGRTHPVPNFCGMARNPQFLFPGCMFMLDRLRGSPALRTAAEPPALGGYMLRFRPSGKSIRSDQCRLDACAPGRGQVAQPAGVLAREGSALISDTHLGHIRGARFLRRIVTTLTRLKPDIVFIAGDMYDGTVAKVNEMAAPLAKLVVPWGAYFVAGNHEEFSDSTKYFDAVKQTGVRVLNSEKVTVDGLQIVGVHYRDSTNDDRFRAALRGAAVDRNRASILLTHAPDRVSIAEQEGFSLQLSGHTHGGQFFPFTWITSRLYGKFVYGLQRLGNLLVYTSYGAGTWGPPLRVGTKPEIVLLQFE